MGTVQFGKFYGIANQIGQVSQNEIKKILNYAWEIGVNTLDTAPSYGDSELQLGNIGVREWNVISKLPIVLPETCSDVSGWVNESIINTLQNLKIKRLKGLLLHRSQHILGGQGEKLLSALASLKSQGIVEKIGVSIYSPEELDNLWPYFHPDLVQAPLNIFDRSLITSGWLSRLHQFGAEVHIRSIFLQGLLLMKPVQRPKFFNRWEALWRQWHFWLEQQSISPLQACLGFASKQVEVDGVVIGVDSIKQLDEIHLAMQHPGILPPDELISEDHDLINPSRWIVTK
ncbi:MAG: aldo/keto reductase [Deltaproteobacteria bacterium]|nr:MAG: aldo/keto reductase [Deltaproteobacteria bacterium]